MPAADYSALMPGAAGTLFYAETPRAPARRRSPSIAINCASAERRRFSRASARTRSPPTPSDCSIAPTAIAGASFPPTRPAKVGEGAIDVDTLEALIDPRAEWAQIFRETWRIQREYFYDATMHGADWPAVYEKYSPLLPFVAHRADLGYLMATVGGELGVGPFLSDWRRRRAGRRSGFGREARRRLRDRKRALPNQEDLRRRKLESRAAGAAQRTGHPGVGRRLSARGQRPTAGAADQRVSAVRRNRWKADDAAREQHALRWTDRGWSPWCRSPSDEALRTRAWIEGNRRLVDKLSGGRLAYVWLPNTGGPGYTAFNRYYYAQQDKEGAIIDERYNQGGMVADYIVNELSRPLMGYFARRDGTPSPSPTVGIYGPKVMIVNESAGSGGDALPFYFKQQKVGPVVGTRTWGALVGTLQIPSTIDGGGVTAPSLAFYDVNGRWAVENEGVAPDIEVENTPADVIAGKRSAARARGAGGVEAAAAAPEVAVPRPAPIKRVSPPRR